VRLGARRGPARRRARPRAAPAAAFTASQMRIRIHQVIGHADLRLQDDVDRAGLQGLEQGLRPRLGQRRTHHHRHRVLGHQLAQEGDAVHARHLDVQGDDVGDLLANALGGHERVGGDADHLDLRILSRTAARVWRTVAESSMIRTRIF
jgi:hypothetical protein